MGRTTRELAAFENEPEIWREIALYFLATVFAFTLGIVATVALQLFV
jgi:hypothetical protein